MKYDTLDYDELTIVHTALDQYSKSHPKYTSVEPMLEYQRLRAILDKLVRETNNELVDRDNRHWNDK